MTATGRGLIVMLALLVFVQPFAAVVVYDTVAVPAAIPVTSPVAAFKLNTVGVEVVQTPLGTELETVAEAPTQSAAGAITGPLEGNGLTVTIT